MKKFLVTVLAVAALFSSCKPHYENRAQMIAAQIQDPHSKYVVVASHRGDWRNFPENSIPAIESVIKMGVDIVEIDLCLTKDSVLVLSHDRTLDRCTTGKGPVSDYTYEQICGFKLRRAHGPAVDTLHMPTLREALMCTKDRICVNIDKGYNYYDEVLAITEELGVTDQILIKGARPLEEVRGKFASHPHNMMYMPIVNMSTERGAALFDSYQTENECPLAYEVCWKDDADLVKTAEKIIAQGSKVWINTLWPSLCGGNGNDDDAAFITGNPEAVYGKYLKMGISMIQTDRPDYLISYLRKVGRHNL